MAEQTIDDLLSIMATLRSDEKGCPWDKEQTFKSLVPYTLEEAYEVADCIERGDSEALPSELGDLLFQVVFYAEVAKEQGLFTFGEVVEEICSKLTRRHPHVFGQEKYLSAAAQNERWEAIKAQERQLTGAGTSALDEVPKNLPGLQRAMKIQKRAARVGFDWPSIIGAREKLNEELAELDAACEAQTSQEIEEEFGDVLFSCVNLARFLEIEPESALRAAIRKFESRFRYIENSLHKAGQDISQQSLEELDDLWHQAKIFEKKTGAEAPVMDQREERNSRDDCA